MAQLDNLIGMRRVDRDNRDGSSIAGIESHFVRFADRGQSKSPETRRGDGQHRTTALVELRLASPCA
jgi:hypothetical protein